ncbi:MAG TPA: PilZ domain-containing protein [Thermoanaerobaculia bacterium]|nr:PilZ domain-containing protein [Thermoanaerobaculia bacterium]
MSRRRAVRRARRVQVHFWKRGEPTSYTGYTTNISMTGMFIATNSPVPQGSRIRIEVIDQDRGFMVEGVVAHARKIRGDLARLNQSGMGVRFLSVEELVRELIPAAYGHSEEIPNSPRTPGPTPPEPPQAAAPPPPQAPPPAAPPLSPEVFRSLASPSPAQAAPPPGPPIGTGGGTFAIRFGGPEEFLEVFRRDIQQGGLFVSTLFPARLQESVLVELHPPLPGGEPVLLRARVVQRFEPHAGEGINLLAGMGLELLDLPAVIQKLQPIVDRLR